MVIKFNNNGYNVIIVLLSVQNTVKPPPATTSHEWLPIENTLELRYTKPPYFKVLGITNDFLYRSISVEKNLDISTKPCYGRQILPFPKPFVRGFNKFLHKWVLKSNRRVYLPKAQRVFDPRGVRGHAPPENFEVLDSRRCIFMHFQVYFFAPKSTKNEA